MAAPSESDSTARSDISRKVATASWQKESYQRLEQFTERNLLKPGSWRSQQQTARIFIVQVGKCEHPASSVWSSSKGSSKMARSWTILAAPISCRKLMKRDENPSKISYTTRKLSKQTKSASWVASCCHACCARENKMNQRMCVAHLMNSGTEMKLLWNQQTLNNPADNPNSKASTQIWNILSAHVVC